MKQCKMCGRENEISNAFCVACGKPLNSNNPNKTQEIIVQVGNFILSIPFYISLLLFGWLLIGSFIMALGASAGSDVNVEEIFNVGLGTILLIFGITSLVFIAFNIIMGKLMYKRNKEKQYIGKYKMVKKVTYVLLAYFLGQYGVHRFVIGDNKGGAIRLIVTLGVPFLIQFWSGLFSGSIITTISFYITIICMMFSYSLSISDFVIGLSKVSNENKMISI